MSVMEVVLRGQIDGQESVNRWNFVSSGAPTSVSRSFALASAFGMVAVSGVYPIGTIISWLVDNLSNTYDFLEGQVRDVFSNTDFYTVPFPASAHGGSSGQASPTFVSYGFLTNRVRTDVGRGYKRFPGVTEEAINASGAIAPAVLVLLEDLADRMTEILSYDDGGSVVTFTPAVCGKEAYVTPRGRTAYKYFASESLQLAHTAQGVVWNPYSVVRSQVSRQLGRGR